MAATKNTKVTKGKQKGFVIFVSFVAKNLRDLRG